MDLNPLLVTVFAKLKKRINLIKWVIGSDLSSKSLMDARMIHKNDLNNIQKSAIKMLFCFKLIILIMFTSMLTPAYAATTPIKVCGNSGWGAILGGNMDNARAKLLNTANFGPSGTFGDYAFSFANIGNPTTATLASNSCDVWFSGYDNTAPYTDLAAFAASGKFVIGGCDNTAYSAVCIGMGHTPTNYSNLGGGFINTTTPNPFTCDGGVINTTMQLTTAGGASSRFTSGLAVAQYNSPTYPLAITDDLIEPSYILTGDVDMFTDYNPDITAGGVVTSDQDKFVVNTFKMAGDRVSGAAAAAGGTDCNNISVDVDLVTVKALTSADTTPEEGDTVTYTITVTNNGDADATDVSLTDVLPAGLTATAINGTQVGGISYNAGTGLWTIGDLADTASATLTIEGVINPGQGGNTIINTTTVAEGDQPDPTTAGDDLTQTITVETPAVLTIVKSWVNANVNDQVNISTSGALNNVNFNSTANTGTENDTDVTTYDVFPGENISFTESYSVGSVTNYTTVLSCTGASDTNANNGLLIDAADTAITCTYTNTLKNPSLNVTKVANDDTAVTVGQVITYTYTATNNGNITLAEVAFTDAHSGSGALANMSLDSTTGTDDAADLNVDTLAPTQTATWTANYTITQADVDAGVAIENTATFTTTTPNLPTTEVTESVAPETAAPSLNVTKIANDATDVTVGQVITYTYTATNDGNITLAEVAFTDAHSGSGSLANMSLDSITGTDDAADLNVDTLAPTQTATWTANYTITQADVDAGVAIENTATFTTTTPNLPTTEITESVAPETAAPSLNVTKIANDATDVTVGQVITYTYTATNNGNITLAEVAFTDAHSGSGALANMSLDSTSGTDDAADLNVDTLAPTQTATWTADYTITQADVDAGVAIENTATFTTTTPNLPTTEITESVAPETAAPSLNVTKIANDATDVTVGQVITYTYTATNNGNITLAEVAFTDAHSGSGALANMSLDSTTGTDDAADLNVDTLAPTQTATWTANYTITQADVDAGVAIENTATFTTTTPNLPTTEVTESVAPETAAPSLNVTKIANDATEVTVGQVITYTYTATNNGNITLADVAFTDAHGGSGALANMSLDSTSGTDDAADLDVDTLAPTQTATWTADYTVTQADIDAGVAIENTATFTTTTPNLPTTEVTESVAPETAAPSLNVTKIANDATEVTVGQVITYTYVATNNGNTTLSDVAFTDAHGGSGSLANMSLDSTTGTDDAADLDVDTLAPTQTATWTADYTVTQADIDAGVAIENTATFTTATAGLPTTEVTESLTTEAAAPSLHVSKIANDATEVTVGQVITYTYVATNNGNTTLSDVAFTDAHGGSGSLANMSLDSTSGTDDAADLDVDTLAPTQTATWTADYTVTQADIDAGVAIENTATFTTATAGLPTTEVTESLTTEAAAPSLHVSKVANDTTDVAVGQVITYTYVATNNGNTTLSDVAFTDAHGGSGALANMSLDSTSGTDDAADLDVDTLAPTQTATWTADYTVTQADIDAGVAIENTATFTTTTPNLPTTEVTESVAPETASPSLNVTKIANDATEVTVGQIITYTYVATNNGNTTLSDVAFTDAHGGSGALANMSLDSTSGTDDAVDLDVDTLAPTQIATWTADYTVTQADIDAGAAIENTATFTTTTPNLPTTEVTESVAPETAAPSLNVTKIANDATEVTVGQVITYTYTATNNGNITLAEVAFTDAHSGSGSLANMSLDSTTGTDDAADLNVDTLAPTQTATWTANYTITQADVDAGAAIENTATFTTTTPNLPVTEVTESVAPETAAPSLNVTKIANDATEVTVGQVITYTYTATNNGNITLAEVAFTDAHSGSGALANMSLDSTTGTDDAADLNVDTLAPTQTATWTADYTVTQADIDAGVAIENTATFTTTTPNLPTTEVTESVAPEVANPSLSVTKTASEDTDIEVGQIVTYTYNAINNGNITLDNVAFTDVHNGSGSLTTMSLDNTTGTDDGADLNVDSLAPTQSATWSADYLVTQADIDAGIPVENTATFTTTIPGLPVTEITESISPEIAGPSLNVTKVSNDDADVTVGQVITYTYIATNNGNVSLSDVTFTDAHSGSGALANMSLDSTTGTDDAADLNVDTLAPTQTATWTANYTITQADVDAGVAIENTATFTTTTPNLPTTEVTESVASETAAPSLNVTKIANDATDVTVGQVITYTYTATNDGNITLAEVAFTDAHSGSGSLANMSLDSTTGTDDAADLNVDTLAPTQTATWTANYTITQADVDAGAAIENTATFTTTTPNLPVTEVTESVAPETAAPSLNVTKIANDDTAVTVGQVITYTYTATNNGNITLAEVAFTDAHSGSGALANMSLDSTTGTDDAADLNVDTLAPTQTATWTANYTITQADVDAGAAIENTATFTTTTPNLPVTEVTESVAPETAAPSLNVTKIANDDTAVTVGQVITYTYTATNNGNITLAEVAFTDAHSGSGALSNMSLDSTTGTDDAADLNVDTLAPTQTATWTANYTITQADVDAGVAIENTATFTTTSTGLSATVVTESVTTETATPRLNVTKTANHDTDIQVGQLITYTYTAFNDGNVTLENVSFTDVHEGSGLLVNMVLNSTTGTDDSADLKVDILAPTQTATWTADYTVTQADIDAGIPVENTATFTTTTSGLPVTEISESVSPEIAGPSLNVTKVANDVSDLEVGQVITYTYVATNNGNTSLNDVTFTDAHSGSGALANMSLDSTTGTDDAADLNVDTLAPTQTATWTANYTITQADVDAGVAIENTATFTTTTPNLPTTEVTESVAPETAAPSLNVTKIANDATDVTVGQVITYTYTATNDGNITLAEVAFTDAHSGSGSLANMSLDSITGTDDAADLNVDTLAPTQTATWTANYTITQADVDAGVAIENTATFSVTTPGLPVTEIIESVSIESANPSWVLVKSSSSIIIEKDDIATYNFSLENTGNVTISSVSLIDAKCDVAPTTPDSGDTNNNTKLDIDETWIFSCNHTVTQAEIDSGSVDNTAKAIGTPASGTLADAPASNSIAVIPDPKLEVVKTARPIAPEDYIVGATVTYDYLVTNSSNVTITSPITINDNLISASDISCDAWPTTGIEPSDTFSCVGTYTVKVHDVAIGSTTNLATATDGTTTSLTDSATVPSGASPAITVTKSSVDTTYASQNQTLTYTYEVENTGSASFAADILVSDNKINGGTPFVCWTSAPSAVPADPDFTPGEIISCNATYNVTQEDLDNGSVTNQASAETTYAGTTNVYAPVVDLTIDADQTPSWILNKASNSIPTQKDDVAEYSFSLENTGNVTISSITLNDAKCDVAPTTPDSGDINNDAKLDTNETWIFSCNHTVTQVEIDSGSVDNSATATGVPAGGTLTETSASNSIPVIQSPDLVVVKPEPNHIDKDGNGDISEGDLLSYTVTATNNGNVSLTNVIVEDDLLLSPNNAVTCFSLAPTETCQLSGDYIVTAADVIAKEVVNYATANSDQTVEQSASVTSVIFEPLLSIVKETPINADEDGNGEISEGDTLTYTVVSTNNGEANLTNVVVIDTLLDSPNNTVTCPILAPTETCSLTGKYTVSEDDVIAGEIVNNATTNSDQTSETIASISSVILKPSLNVVKPDPINADEDGNGEISVGDTLTYTVTVTNDGDATLTNVMISDSLLAPPNDTTTCAIVAPLGTCELSGEYIVTTNDLANGSLTNNASANSDQTPESLTSNTVTILEPLASFEKSNPVNSDEDGNAVVSVGDTLSYTITMTNIGTATLSNVVVSDELISPETITCATVAPTDSCTLVGIKTVEISDIDAGEIVNTARGSATQIEPMIDSVTTKTANPEIRSAKSAGLPKLNADGTFDIEYNIIVKNSGTVTLNSLTLIDDLATQLGTSLHSIVSLPTASFVNNTSGNSQLPTINNVFTGIAPATNLINGNDGQLYAGDSYQVNFTVRINPNSINAPDQYNNQAVVGGTSGSLVVTDLSDSGTNPDSSNENIPTTLVIPEFKPELQSTKFAGAPVLNADLTFNVPFTIIVKNTGNVNMNTLNLEDDISSNNQMGSAFISIVTPPNAGISNNVSGTAIAPTANVNFDGRSSNPKLLIGNDGFLAPQDEYTVNFVIRINPNAAGVPSELRNQAMTTAVSPSGITASDLSDAGNSNNGGQNGSPGDTGDTDIPTILPVSVLTVPTAELLISKVAGKKEAAAGDLIPYTILIKNKSSFIASGVTLVDDLPSGFKIVKESIKIKTYDANHELVSTTNANTTGNDPVNIAGVTIPVESNGYVKISYMIRVGSNIQSGKQCNKISASIRATSNTATACVLIEQNTVLDQSTLIGKVFHDRDSDGYQDDARVTGITLKSDYFGWNSLHLGGLNARLSVLDDPTKHRKVVRMPLGKTNHFKITTQQGTVINVDNFGQVSESHVGLKAKGMTGQDIRVSTKRTQGIPTPTKIAAMKKPATPMDVLEITITNYGIQEEGIPGVRLATIKGLLIETDGHGRYHIPDTDGGLRNSGKNFIIKVDTASLPNGARLTTENPRVLRLSGAALNKINFGVKLPIQSSPVRHEQQEAKYETVTKTHTSKKKTPIYKSVNVNLGSIFFDNDKHNIRSDQRGNMELLISRIRKYGQGHIRIDAHTDSNNHAKYNIALAQRRASTIKNELQKSLGSSLMKRVIVEVDRRGYQESPDK